MTAPLALKCACASKNPNNPANNLHPTPAAINNETPEPNPHLEHTSSINNISIPPKTSWIITIAV